MSLELVGLAILEGEVSSLCSTLTTVEDDECRSLSSLKAQLIESSLCVLGQLSSGPITEEVGCLSLIALSDSSPSVSVHLLPVAAILKCSREGLRFGLSLELVGLAILESEVCGLQVSTVAEDNLLRGSLCLDGHYVAFVSSLNLCAGPCTEELGCLSLIALTSCCPGVCIDLCPVAIVLELSSVGILFGLLSSLILIVEAKESELRATAINLISATTLYVEGVRGVGCFLDGDTIVSFQVFTILRDKETLTAIQANTHCDGAVILRNNSINRTAIGSSVFTIARCHEFEAFVILVGSCCSSTELSTTFNTISQSGHNLFFSILHVYRCAGSEGCPLGQCIDRSCGNPLVCLAIGKCKVSCLALVTLVEQDVVRSKESLEANAECAISSSHLSARPCTEELSCLSLFACTDSRPCISIYRLPASIGGEGSRVFVQHVLVNLAILECEISSLVACIVVENDVGRSLLGLNSNSELTVATFHLCSRPIAQHFLIAIPCISPNLSHAVGLEGGAEILQCNDTLLRVILSAILEFEVCSLVASAIVEDNHSGISHGLP